MKFSRVRRDASFVVPGMGLLAVLFGCTGPGPNGSDAGSALAQTLYVAHDDGTVVSYDIESGHERPGTATDALSPTDMQALEDGTVMLNLTGKNQVLALDGRTMLERARLESSSVGGTRPVHSYLTPQHSGRRYWVALNDGQGGDVGTNSAAFVQVPIGDGGTFRRVGEVRLGVGHHKGAFSNTRERAVFSSIADCDAVVGVYDYSEITQVRPVKTWSAAELGWDGSSYAKKCDPTYKTGAPPALHGCATSKLSGKAYCNLTTSGELVVISLDAEAPTAIKISTQGKGGGYTKASKDGRYVYSLQESPREGQGGVTCQVGQLVTINAQTDAVVSQIPLLKTGPACAAAISGSDEETAEPGHILLTSDGKKMYVGLAGGFGVETARVRHELVLDLADPAHPVQKDSVEVGASSGHHGDTLSGDGKFVFVANNKGGSVTQIDVATDTVVRTFSVRAGPEVVSTFGTAEGPSLQTGPLE